MADSWRPEPPVGELVLDPAALDQLRRLDPDSSRGFVAQILQTYHRSLARQLAELTEAAAAGDARLAAQIGHTLKSSSASVGAVRLATLAAALERRVKDGDMQALGEPLQAMLHEGQRVLHAVQAMLAQ